MDLRWAIKRSRLFAPVDTAVVRDLADAATVVDLRGGGLLYAMGEPSDALYIVVSGRLRSVIGDNAVGDYGVGETVGETGLMADQPRAATVIAARDSVLVRIERSSLMQVLVQHPAAALQLSQAIIARVTDVHRDERRRSLGHLRTIAMLESRPGRGGREAVRRLSESLGQSGQVRVVDEKAVDEALGSGAAEVPFENRDANLRLVRWLNEVESTADFVILTSAKSSGSWVRRVLRQSDRILVLADSGDPPGDGQLRHELKTANIGAPVQLLFRRPAAAPAGDVSGWCEALKADAHYFWESGRDEPFQSLARQLSGRGVGLVLGGGGARGFAHLGLLRALDELGIPVDLAGGSSMGAFIAAMCACGLSHLDMVRECRSTFVDRNYLNDYMLPRVALIRGKRFLKHLQEIFGAVHIESLRMPYFCVTTNLTKGRPEVHRHGPLALWVATSMSVPGVAPPLAWRGDLLADGSVINSLPTDIMQRLDRGPIVASDVSTEDTIDARGIDGPDPEAFFHWTSDSPRPTLFDILFRTATLTSESGVQARAERADVYLRMPVQDAGMFDWGQIDTLARIGYEHAMAVLPPVRDHLLGKVAWVR